MSHHQAMNAPIHTNNGGNTIIDGQALRKPVYTGDDFIDPVVNWFAIGALVSGLLSFAVLFVMACRAGGSI